MFEHMDAKVMRNFGMLEHLSIPTMQQQSQGTRLCKVCILNQSNFVKALKGEEKLNLSTPSSLYLRA